MDLSSLVSLQKRMNVIHRNPEHRNQWLLGRLHYFISVGGGGWGSDPALGGVLFLLQALYCNFSFYVFIWVIGVFNNEFLFCFFGGQFFSPQLWRGRKLLTTLFCCCCFLLVCFFVRFIQLITELERSPVRWNLIKCPYIHIAMFMFCGKTWLLKSLL